MSSQAPARGETDPAASIAERLGEVGLPAPISELACREWDAIVVGGGHNGLTTAAYLARSGRRVIVLERRERLGGACTLERPFADERCVVSPCAYVVGLLDRRVVGELGLRRRGLRHWLAEPNLWVPFEDGGCFAQYADDGRTQASLDSLGLSPRDVDGYWRCERLFERARLALREGARDAWLGESPSRAELEQLLGGERELIDLVFEASIAEVLDAHIGDRRLKDALFGGGVIGSWAGPRDPGTAWVKLMHHLGELDGHGAAWGYVEGGMGMVSFAIGAAAREAGAVLCCGTPVERILPGEGVLLDDGTRLLAPTVICNADPKRMLGMLDGAEIEPGFRERVEAWRVRSPVVKLNAALDGLPSFDAGAGAAPTPWPARAMVDLSGGIDAVQRAFEACRGGEPAVGFAEVYCQTGYDPSTAPPGTQLVSAFAQYAPYELARGDWDSRREEVTRQVVGLIERFAPGFETRLLDCELLGPADIERRVGLTGGNIFQGEVTPDQMWERRFAARTPVDGLYMCGAATHPAGSVIGLNGRNAAAAVLADRGLDFRPT